MKMKANKKRPLRKWLCDCLVNRNDDDLKRLAQRENMA